MIPKVIHYCWFGGNAIPEKNKKCIESWKKYCPEYEIIEWNESNYDILQNTYIKQAYDTKRWAFVSDYVRLDIIYQYGGIYLDTDVELVKNLDSLLENKAFAGMENVIGEKYSVNTGLGFGAEKSHAIIKAWKDTYDNLEFCRADGTIDLLTTPARTTKYLEEKGFQQKNTVQIIDDMVIYPTEYFCPMQYDTGKLRITDNTYSIHHYSESWKTEEEQRAKEAWVALVKKYGKHGAEIISVIKSKRNSREVAMIFKKILTRLFHHSW